ncbi:MAG: 50S ribosomal protein L1 [Phycisphaerales bacterium]
MTKKTKANLAIAEKYDGPQTPTTAIAGLKEFKAAKFDQSVEVVAFLGIDPRQADQQLRGSLSFPKGVGRSARVICFCGPDKLETATAAGAVKAGGEDLVEEVAGGWMDFDVAVASPEMMRVVSKLGRVLGPKGLMPSPKAGTVTPDVATAVREYSAGKLEYRNDDYGNIHCVIGKMSFSNEDLLENLEFFVNHIEKIRPAAAKGDYLKKMVVSATMTPGIQIAV